MQNKIRAIFSLKTLRKSVRFWILSVMLPLQSHLQGQDWYNAQWSTDSQRHFSKYVMTFKGYSRCLKSTPEVMGGIIAQMQHFVPVTGRRFLYVHFPVCRYNRNITLSASFILKRNRKKDFQNALGFFFSFSFF